MLAYIASGVHKVHMDWDKIAEKVAQEIWKYNKKLFRLMSITLEVCVNLNRNSFNFPTLGIRALIVQCAKAHLII